MHVHLGKQWGQNGGSSPSISEERLSESLRENRIDKAVVFAQPYPSPYIKGKFVPSQANRRVGNYAQTEDRAVPFCYVDHRHKACGREVKTCVKSYDVRGVKIHAGLNRKWENGASVLEISDGLLDCVEEYGLLVTIHLVSEDATAFAEIASKRQNTTFIVAHLGLLESPLMDCAKLGNVYLDTSAVSRENSLFTDCMTPKERVEYAKGHVGENKLLFGSDVPWTSLEKELSAVSSRKILHENACGLLYAQ